jgi:8-oxo-dGTP pyrophosphatase MutT (NUDIX family)
MYRQSGVIPYRRGVNGVEVLLITSRKGKRWVIPKGVIEPNMTPAASAAKEAIEEAGVRGDVDERPLGKYRYAKWGGVCTVQVFAMAVSVEAADWPEAEFRSRVWLPLADARGRVDEKGLKAMFDDLSKRVKDGGRPMMAPGDQDATLWPRRPSRRRRRTP